MKNLDPSERFEALKKRWAKIRKDWRAAVARQEAIWKRARHVLDEAKRIR